MISTYTWLFFFLNRRISGWMPTSCFDLCMRPWMLLRRIAWDSGIACQRTELLWNSWVERLLTTTSMLMMDTCYMNMKDLKQYPHICLFFPGWAFLVPFWHLFFFFRCATFPPATKARPAPVRLLLSLGKNYEGATWCCHCGNKKMDPILPTWVTKTDFPFKMWSVSFFAGGFLNCGIWSNGLCQC